MKLTEILDSLIDELSTIHGTDKDIEIKLPFDTYYIVRKQFIDVTRNTLRVPNPDWGLSGIEYLSPTGRILITPLPRISAAPSVEQEEPSE